MRCLCLRGRYLCFWSLMPSTQVGESEFFHMATGGRSSCCEMLIGWSVCCHCFNKLHAADWMTFVNLSGLVTWENLSKPHTLEKIPLSTRMITVFNLDSQAYPSGDICLTHVIHGLSAHKTHSHSQSIQTFLDKDGRVASNLKCLSSPGYLSMLVPFKGTG